MTTASARRRRALEAYMERVRDLMRLQAWDVSVGTDVPNEPTSLLEITPHEARHSANVRVGGFFTVDRQEQRYVVCHELIHLLQAGAWEFLVSGTAEAVMRPAGLQWISERLLAEMEIQADALARLLAPRMPLPPKDWPT